MTTDADRLTRFATRLGSLIPDAMSTAVAMVLLVGLAAVALGNPIATVGEAYYRGLWMLLPFTMQMTLILVLSSAMGSSPFFKRTVVLLSRFPRSEFAVYALSVALTAGLSYLYWGLGLALGPLIAVYFARQAEERGIAVDFPFFLATTLAATSVWQFGLSSTAPLQMNTPGHFLEKTTGLMPLSTTIWAPSSVLFIVAFLFAILVAARLLKPATPQQISTFPDAHAQAAPLSVAEAEPIGRPATSEGPSERLERNSVLTLLLAACLVIWLYYHFAVKDLGLDLFSMNTFLLLGALLVHRNVRNFSKALQVSVTTAWPIIVLYHIYAAVAGLLQFTTVGQEFAGAMAAISNRYTFPFFTAAASAVVSLFVPSSGGQWAIQGFVTATAAEAVGVSAQRGLLALSVGDQIGNLTTPFWAVIGAGIARIDFRKYIGYSFVFATIWFVLGVVIFTFMPA
ncbi:MAG: short-chain fatty acid transporter [Gemmatimonadetes bacterium]|nr:short-chain fatty acid transporter [Gemmatimonadota bacterium]